MSIDRKAIFSAETRIVTDLTYFAGAPEISTTQAKTGTYSYIRNSNDGPIGKAFSTPLTAVRVGWWQYMADTDIFSRTWLYHAGLGLGSGNDVNFIGVSIDSSTGLMTVERPLSHLGNETLESVSLPSIFGTTGTWFHIGVTHKIGTVDGFLSVYINGTRVLNLLADTQPTSADNLGQYPEGETAHALVSGAGGTSGIQGYANGGAFVDDILVDSYIGEDDAPVPSRRFLPSLPDGVGVDAEWTPEGGAINWQNVDDNPNDGDVTYNKALSTGLRDTFTYSDIVLPADHRIVAVVPSAFAKRLDSELDHKLSVHAWDGVQYGDSADIDLTMSYDVPAFASLPLQPDGSEWTEADFNAMQFGYRSRGVF